MIWTPPFGVVPENTKQSTSPTSRAPASERKFDAFGSMPSLKASSMPCLLERVLDVLGEAGAVDLLVVGDGDVLAAVLGHDRRQGRALDRVLRDDAQVVALTRRVVLLGLARLGARLVRGQADRGVRGRDLRDRRLSLVEDRHRDRRGARVELADVGDGAVVLRDATRVGRGGLRRPVADLSRGVVERLVLHGDVAGLVARLLERELDAVDHRRGLKALSALEREARVDVDGAAFAAAAPLPRCRRRRPSPRRRHRTQRCRTARCSGRAAA